MNVYQKQTIVEAVQRTATKTQLAAIAEAFVAYSDGSAQVPPVGHLNFSEPPGDVHIKYGHIAGDDYYIIKIASGFHDNPKIGLPPGNGMMLAFESRTGRPAALLRDEGWLTDLRTALAGAVAAKNLAPEAVHRIGIVGTGVQARMQLQQLAAVNPCRKALVWGRNFAKAEAFAAEMSQTEFTVEPTDNLPELVERSQLIVTTTPSEKPLIQADWVQPGTHITAMGSDTPGKQELATALIAKADVVACDSISQCLAQGEAGWAVKAGLIPESSLVELGHLIPDFKRPAQAITIADLTGIATQDIKITNLALRLLNETS